MIRTSRRCTLGLIASLTALGLSGCGNSPLHTGAAATVGSQRISTTALAGLVRRGLADPQAEQQLGADRVAFQRQALGRLINHDVLAEAARRKDVTVSDAEVQAKRGEFERQAGGSSQLLQQAAQNGIAVADLPGFIHDVVLNEALGAKLTQDVQVPQAQLAALYASSANQNDQVHVAHILVPTRVQAEKILATVKSDPASFAAQAARFSTDASNAKRGGDLGFAGRGAFVKPFEAAIFAAKAGDYLVVQTQFGFHVVHVLERRTTSFADALPMLRRAALQKQRQSLTSELLRRVAKELGVHINPRFGRWDGSTGSVIAARQGPGSVSSPAADPAGASGGRPAPAPSG